MCSGDYMTSLDPSQSEPRSKVETCAMSWIDLMASVSSPIFPSASDEQQTRAKSSCTTSLPPSPPSTGANTPTLRIAPCPVRLLPIFPPYNFGGVDYKSIFRSSFPLERNLDFMMRLGIKTVLCLVDTEPTEQYSRWVSAKGIKRLQVDIAANKEGTVKTTNESLYEAVLYVMTKANHPIHVHCNQGKHRTGCVVACVRVVQGTMTMEEIVEEYVVYAGKKARSGDLELIRSFDSWAFADFVAACNHVKEPYTGFFIRRRVDSGAFGLDLTDADGDVDMLLDTSPRVSQYSDENIIAEQVTKKMASRTLSISREAVDRVRLIMGEGPAVQRTEVDFPV